MRPENPYKLEIYSVASHMKSGAFEQGIDATIAALRAEGVHCRADNCLVSEFLVGNSQPASWILADKFRGKEGVLHFIPDDEVELFEKIE